MIVPQYWAEAKIKKRVKGRQVTIKRFGWSDASETEAQQHADNRAAEAMALIESGKEKINRREPKIAYNGAEGVPIREEIITHCKDCVITRNSYGALCLNTPDVLFADVDFETEPKFSLYLFVFIFLMTAAGIAGFLLESGKVFAAIAFGAVILTPIFATLLFKLFTFFSGGVQKWAKNRIRKFVKNNPDWHLRIYQTPAGYRVLVMHKTFDPTSEETERFFKALKSDPMYMVMCKKQHCFRARLSPKPWRIGIDAHLKPRPGVWPINPDRLPDRIKWVENYERAAHKYASCRFEEKLGSNALDPKAEYVRLIHDRYCNANSDFAIA